jgi:lysophospholipase L1-like esterase
MTRSLGLSRTRLAGRRGVSSGAAAFNPLADPDLIGLWDAANASDNGTTLTWPNSLTGGAAITSTGAGRATIGATALDTIRPAIQTSGMTQFLTASIGAAISGKTEATIYVVASDTSDSGTYLLRHGNGFQSFFIRTNVPGAGRLDFERVASEGTAIVQTTNTSAGRLNYPRVLCARFDISRATGESLPLVHDGYEIPGASSGPADTTGTIQNSTLYVGTQFASLGTPFPGVIGAIAIVAREHTNAEVAQWTTYLRQLTGQQRTRDLMWCGDSITVGLSGGYRKRVDDLYQARGDGVRYLRTIGPTTGAVYAGDFYNAQAGRTIAQLEATMATTIGSGNPFRPQIISLLIGTNDIGVGPGLSGMDTRYRSLLDTITSLEPSALIVANACLARTDSFSDEVETWNETMLPDVITDAQAAGINVILDTTAYDTPGIVLSDGLHPTAGGYSTLGDALEPRTRVWAGVT